MHTLKSPHAVEDIDFVFVLTGNKHNQCLKVKRQLHFSSRRNYTMQPASWTRFFLSSLTSGTIRFTKGQANLVIGFFWGGSANFGVWNVISIFRYSLLVNGNSFLCNCIFYIWRWNFTITWTAYQKLAFLKNI